MKKTTTRFYSLLLAFLLFSFPAFTVFGAIPPIDLHWGCDSNEIFEKLIDKETLQGKFIKNSARERITEVCAYRGKIFLLIEKTTGENGERTIRGGIYLIPKEKAYREKRSHDFSVTCYIQRTSSASRIDYLCYNPTVAAGSTQGEEFSFRVQKRQSFQRSCTVYFGGLKNKECEKWERLR